VLALNVCDPAMGFLARSWWRRGRQIAARADGGLGRATPQRAPRCRPTRMDEDLLARRLVAQRCLYGVDRNPMAVDLARLSLWLATLARDHEFTFLDHALRVGDSLVGCCRAIRWDAARLAGRGAGHAVRRASCGSVCKPPSRRGLQIRAANDGRRAVSSRSSVLPSPNKHLAELRLAGDAVIAAHFCAERGHAHAHQALERLRDTATHTNSMWAALRASAATLATGAHPLRPVPLAIGVSRGVRRHGRRSSMPSSAIRHSPARTRCWPATATAIFRGCNRSMRTHMAMPILWPTSSDGRSTCYGLTARLGSSRPRQ